MVRAEQERAESPVELPSDVFLLLLDEYMDLIRSYGYSQARVDTIRDGWQFRYRAAPHREKGEAAAHPEATP